MTKKQQLGQQQLLILKYLANDKRQSEIAQILGISPRTVEHKIRDLKKQFEVKTSTGLIYKYLKS